MNSPNSTENPNPEYIGRYRIDDKIGQGGVGEVFRAHDSQLHRWVAVKRLFAGEFTDAERAHKLISEARHLAALQHPNVVTIYDVVEDRGDILVVMELINGHTLQEIGETSALAVSDFLSVMQQSLAGLSAAHEIGMLHRDIKPSNIMAVDLPGGGFQIKILDFGLAKVSEFPSLQTQDAGGGVLGSIHTMSPEQFEGAPIDARSDLYSLGCVAYFILTMTFPFNGERVPEVISAHLHRRMHPLQTFRPDLPPELCAWVDRLMATDPSDRPASAAVALQELSPLLADQESPDIELVETPPKPRPWNLPILAAGLAVALLLGGGAFTGYALSTRNQTGNTPSPKAVAPSKIVSSPSNVSPTPSGNPGVPGQTLVVDGQVLDVLTHANKKILFLSMSGTAGVTPTFFVEDAPADFTVEKLAAFQGKQVRISGQRSDYRGTAQLVVSALSDITVIP